MARCIKIASLFFIDRIFEVQITLAVQSNTLRQILSEFHQTLSLIYSENEARAITYLILDELAGFKKSWIALNRDSVIEDNVNTILYSALNELKKGVPPQYVIGHTWFLNCKIKLSPEVLIPRPETEELTQRIINDHSSNNDVVKVLDLCTGSGCIAVAIKNSISTSIVKAIDISHEALEIAKENARENKADVEFVQADVLNMNEGDFPGKFDVMVSNPPYVREMEKKIMARNVLDHEPGLALFVNDNDPLLFYRHILNFAIVKLASSGTLYLEINEFLGNEMKELAESIGFTSVQLGKDLSGRERFLTCKH